VIYPVFKTSKDWTEDMLHLEVTVNEGKSLEKVRYQKVR
jgi:hypothetical protein